MADKKKLEQIQQARLDEVKQKNHMENLFVDLCGSIPSVIRPNYFPFVVFNPATKEEYLNILNKLEPLPKMANITFGNREAIVSGSPYTIKISPAQKTESMLEAVVTFECEICPVWIKLSGDLLRDKFIVLPVTTVNMITDFTLIPKLEETYSMQDYAFGHRTMYASNEQEAENLKLFIFS